MGAMIYLSESFDIVHRDIKPENILIFKKDYPFSSFEDRFYKAIQRENEMDFKLCGKLVFSPLFQDFGFSDKHGMCGTECIFSFLSFILDYTEPHVYRGQRKHCLVSDMWSLGIVAHFALFGINPLYQLSREHNLELFMPTILIKRENWEQLGPILRRLVFW